MTPLEDLSLLRAFVRIVESGSISAAARTSKIPQPTLSRHLRILEEGCGTLLLRRDTHAMSLTEAGQRLFQDAAVILEMVEGAAQRLLDDRTVLRGHLRLFATIDFGQSIVSRLIARFLRAHPEITADLKCSNRPPRMIDEGFDVGIMAGDIQDDRVVARSVGSVRRYVVAAPELVKKYDAVRAPEDLETWPWIALGGTQFGETARVTLHTPRKASVQVQIAPILTAEGVTGMREVVREGAGVAVLPDWLARDDVVAGRLVRVLPEWEATELAIHVIYPGDRTMPARVREFVDFAVDSMTAELRKR